MHNCCDKLSISTLINFKNAEYNFYKCSDCGLIKTYPVIQNEDVYESGHYSVKAFTFIPLIINFLDYLYYLIIFKTLGFNSKSKLLDFGSGKGLFLFFLKNFNYKNIYGLETSQSRAKFSKELTKLKIFTNYYTGGLIGKEKFDFISMIHVLEHIDSPFRFLNLLIEGGLKKNGSIFIEVPNIDSFSYHIAKNNWAHFTPHFHTNHFTIKSIKSYCEKNSLNFKLNSTFSFYNSAMGMTSCLLSIFGYRGIIFEDLKSKKLSIIFSFLILLPISLISELILSFFNKGSILKVTISR